MEHQLSPRAPSEQADVDSLKADLQARMNRAKALINRGKPLSPTKDTTAEEASFLPQPSDAEEEEQVSAKEEEKEGEEKHIETEGRRRTLTQRAKTSKALEGFYKGQQQVQHLKDIELSADVRCLGAVGEDQVYIASRDGTIHVRDSQLASSIGVIRAHRPKTRITHKIQVNCIFSDQLHGKVWVGSSDSIIRIYDFATRKMLHELTDHSGGVKCIVGSEEYVWSCSEDFTVFQRCIDDGSVIKHLVGHSNWVHCMAVDDMTGQLWSGSVDGIRIWSQELSSNGGGSVNGDETPRQLRRASKQLSSSSSRASIVAQVDGFVDSNCLVLLKGHDSTVLSLIAVGDKVWSGAADKSICVWDVKDRTLLKKFKAHNNWVHCLRPVDEEVWSASGKEIKVWDQDGNHVRDVELPPGFRGKVADMVFTRGRLWLGLRSPGSLHVFRIHSTTAGLRVRQIASRRGVRVPPSSSSSSSLLVNKSDHRRAMSQVDVKPQIVSRLRAPHAVSHIPQPKKKGTVAASPSPARTRTKRQSMTGIPSPNKTTSPSLRRQASGIPRPATAASASKLKKPFSIRQPRKSSDDEPTAPLTPTRSAVHGAARSRVLKKKVARTLEHPTTSTHKKLPHATTSSNITSDDDVRSVASDDWTYAYEEARALSANTSDNDEEAEDDLMNPSLEKDAKLSKGELLVKVSRLADRLRQKMILLEKEQLAKLLLAAKLDQRDQESNDLQASVEELREAQLKASETFSKQLEKARGEGERLAITVRQCSKLKDEIKELKERNLALQEESDNLRAVTQDSHAHDAADQPVALELTALRKELAAEKDRVQALEEAVKEADELSTTRQKALQTLRSEHVALQANFEDYKKEAQLHQDELEVELEMAHDVMEKAHLSILSVASPTVDAEAGTNEEQAKEDQNNDQEQEEQEQEEQEQEQEEMTF